MKLRGWAFKHGYTRTRTYTTWQAIKTRCHDHARYPKYGGAGITYDPRWEKFENFLEDMGPRPEDHSIDRIDPTGNYTKENCRWATRLQQTKNRSPYIRKRRAVECHPGERHAAFGLCKKCYQIKWIAERKLTKKVG